MVNGKRVTLADQSNLRTAVASLIVFIAKCIMADNDLSSTS